MDRSSIGHHHSRCFVQRAALLSAKDTMETLEFVGAAVAFFGFGALMVLYENVRSNAGRPILNGSPAVQLYYVSYLTMFVLGATVLVAAIVR
jgi:hypothetical protein